MDALGPSRDRTTLNHAEWWTPALAPSIEQPRRPGAHARGACEPSLRWRPHRPRTADRSPAGRASDPSVASCSPRISSSTPVGARRAIVGQTLGRFPSVRQGKRWCAKLLAANNSITGRLACLGTNHRVASRNGRGRGRLRRFLPLTVWGWPNRRSPCGALLRSFGELVGSRGQ